MLQRFGETKVEEHGHVYILDLSRLNEPQTAALVAIALAVVAMFVVARHYSWKALLRSVGFACLALFAGWAHVRTKVISLSWHRAEGHLYKLYWPQLEPMFDLLIGTTWIVAFAAAALFLLRPAAIRDAPAGEQVQALWPRALFLVPLLAAWGLSLGALRTFQGLERIGRVPVFEFPAHAPVQRGQPFAIKPDVRVVGRVVWHLFRDDTPYYMNDDDLAYWSLPDEPFVAEQLGDNRFPYRMVRRLPLRLSVEGHFNVEAKKEQGSPLFPLQVGDTWRYRFVGPERKPQPAGGSPDLVLRVDGEAVRDGVREFALDVYRREARGGEFFRERRQASQWEGETFVHFGDTRVPLLARRDDETGTVPGLIPCTLAVLPKETGCYCLERPLDARRSLLGLSHCIRKVVDSHDGENLLVFGLGLLTLGLSSVGKNGLSFRNTDVRYYGLVLEDAGQVPDLAGLLKQ